MKKLNLYGQLVLIIVSYLPLINSYSDDWLISFLHHGLFLIVLATWQMIGTINNILDYDDSSITRPFKRNFTIAVMYFLFCFCYLRLFGPSTWFLVSSLLLADVLIIRYWMVLKKHYQL